MQLQVLLYLKSFEHPQRILDLKTLYQSLIHSMHPLPGLPPPPVQENVTGGQITDKNLPALPLRGTLQSDKETEGWKTGQPE